MASLDVKTACEVARAGSGGMKFGMDGVRWQLVAGLEDMSHVRSSARFDKLRDIVQVLKVYWAGQ